MKKKIFKLAMLMLGTTALFQGCKKGADDPFISFRSRAARVEGDWKATWTSDATTVTTSTTGTSSTSSSSEVNDGTKTTTKTTTGNQISTITQNETLVYSFKKDGTYTSTSTNTSIVIDTIYSYDNNFNQLVEYRHTFTNTTVRVVDGKWNFLSGIGDVKNKECMEVAASQYVETTTSNDAYVAITVGAAAKPAVNNTYVSTNTYSPNNASIWKLTELKNKEIKAEIEENNSQLYSENGINGDKSTTTGTKKLLLTAK